MGALQHDLNPANLCGNTGSRKSKGAKAEQKTRTMIDIDAQDAALWDAEINASVDTLYAMADKALANYDAGLTRKISG